MDISGNDFVNIDDVDISEDIESSEDVSGDSSEASFEDQGDDYVGEPQTATLESSFDYSPYFENIETLFKFQIAVIIGFLLCVCFIVGWKHD